MPAEQRAELRRRVAVPDAALKEHVDAAVGHVRHDRLGADVSRVTARRRADHDETLIEERGWRELGGGKVAGRAHVTSPRPAERLTQDKTLPRSRKSPCRRIADFVPAHPRVEMGRRPPEGSTVDRASPDALTGA